MFHLYFLSSFFCVTGVDEETEEFLRTSVGRRKSRAFLMEERRRSGCAWSWTDDEVEGCREVAEEDGREGLARL